MSPAALGIVSSAIHPLIPLVPTFRGFTDTPTVVGGGPTTYTYANAPIGPASANRTVVVMATSWSAGNRSFTSMTIGGTPATQDYYSGAFASIFSMWRAVITTGSTADVVLTGQDNTLDVCLSVWTVDSAVAVQSAAFTPSPVGSTSTTVTAPSTVAGGFAICGFSARSTAYTTVWTNSTERFDTGTAQPHSGADAATTGTSLAVIATYSIATNNASQRVGIVAYKPA